MPEHGINRLHCNMLQLSSQVVVTARGNGFCCGETFLAKKQLRRVRLNCFDKFSCYLLHAEASAVFNFWRLQAFGSTASLQALVATSDSSPRGACSPLPRPDGFQFFVLNAA